MKGAGAYYKIQLTFFPSFSKAAIHKHITLQI